MERESLKKAVIWVTKIGKDRVMAEIISLQVINPMCSVMTSSLSKKRLSNQFNSPVVTTLLTHLTIQLQTLRSSIQPKNFKTPTRTIIR